MVHENIAEWKTETIILDCNIQDEELLVLIDDVLGRITEGVKEEFPSFNIYAATTMEGAYVMEDNVCFDVNKMSGHTDEVQIGIIAHELAHKFLCHDETSGLDEEAEADDLAKEWGFTSEIDALRKKLGPPRLE